MEYLTELIKTQVIMLAAAAVPLLAYAFRSAGFSFTIRCFILTSKTRLFYGFLLMLLCASLLTFVDGVAEALVSVGFTPHASVAGVGFAIGGMLVSLIPGDKA